MGMTPAEKALIDHVLMNPGGGDPDERHELVKAVKLERLSDELLESVRLCVAERDAATTKYRTDMSHLRDLYGDIMVDIAFEHMRNHK